MKWRGIHSTEEVINEDEAVTIVNRLGQKSISLPRITDDKRWAGFPGLSGVAKKIAKMVPKCATYVEPFAGAAKVYQELPIEFSKTKYTFATLNDKSKFVYKWLQQEFPLAFITNWDFKLCIKYWDSKDTFFLLDPPYNKSYYDQVFSTFNRESVNDYYTEVLELCKGMKGKFIITSRKENKLMLESGFKTKLVKSIYAISGKLPRVLVTTNLD